MTFFAHWKFEKFSDDIFSLSESLKSFFITFFSFLKISEKILKKFFFEDLCLYSTSSGKRFALPTHQIQKTLRNTFFFMHKKFSFMFFLCTTRFCKKSSTNLTNPRRRIIISFLECTSEVEVFSKKSSTTLISLVQGF